MIKNIVSVPMLKKSLLATVASVAMIPCAQAEISFSDINSKSKLTVGSSVTVLSPFVKEYGDFKKLSRDSNEIHNASDSNLYSNKVAASGNISFDLSTMHDDALQYGIYAKLNANTSLTSSGNANIADKMMLYIDNKNFGRAEFGSNDGAYKNIKISPADLAVGTGGIDGDFSDYFSYGAFLKSDNKYYNISGAFYTSVNLPGSGAKRANKFTYYTPKMHGFSAGMSFIPDTDHQGTIYEPSSGQITKNGMGYTTVLELAAKFENSVQDFNYGFSIVGNIGQAKTAQYTVDVVNASGFDSKTDTFNVKRNNLAAAEIGFQIGYKGFNLSGTYGHLGKSGALKENMTKIGGAAADDIQVSSVLKGKPKTYFYSAGAAYKYDKFSASVTYYHSSALGRLAVYNKDAVKALTVIDADGSANKFDSISVGLNYNVLDNLNVFAEYTHFKYSKKTGDIVKIVNADASQNGKISLNKGNVIFAGIKAKF